MCASQRESPQVISVCAFMEERRRMLFVRAHFEKGVAAVVLHWSSGNIEGCLHCSDCHLLCLFCLYHSVELLHGLSMICVSWPRPHAAHDPERAASCIFFFFILAFTFIFSHSFLPESTIAVYCSIGQHWSRCLLTPERSNKPSL